MERHSFHDREMTREEEQEEEEGSHLLQEIEIEKELESPRQTYFASGSKPSAASLYSYLQRLMFFLLPSFLQARARPGTNKPEKLHPTAFLDGMRGLAALFVFFYHLSYSSHNVLVAYGAGQPGENREFLKLPFVRFIYTGPAMVAIFYVVSGYALSYKPVRLMRSRNWKELLHTLSSSVFRRAIRLYIPCIVSTLMIVFLVRIGVYEWTRGIAYDDKRLTNVRETHLHRFDTLSEQLADWAHKMWIFIHPWSFGTKDTDIDIDRHLWTIPMEFRSSLVLYLTQLGLARLKPFLRLTSLAGLITWCLFKDRWEMILFYSGFYFAELDFMRRASAAASSLLPSQTGTAPSADRNKRFWNGMYIAVFLIGIYLCSQPQEHVDQGIGWATLHSWIPKYVHQKQRFWVGWGAILLVWATSNAWFLQRIFDNGPVQYLGKISFALYLMHGLVTHTVGYGLMDVLWQCFGTQTVFRKEFGFAIAGTIDVLTTIWVADVFWRAVDIPVVKFGKWFEESCIVRLED